MIAGHAGLALADNAHRRCVRRRRGGRARRRRWTRALGDRHRAGSRRHGSDAAVRGRGHDSGDRRRCRVHPGDLRAACTGSSSRPAPCARTRTGSRGSRGLDGDPGRAADRLGRARRASAWTFHRSRRAGSARSRARPVHPELQGDNVYVSESAGALLVLALADGTETRTHPDHARRDQPRPSFAGRRGFVLSNAARLYAFTF